MCSRIKNHLFKTIEPMGLIAPSIRFEKAVFCEQALAAKLAMSTARYSASVVNAGVTIL
jgi:hypothetical protein